MKKPLTESQRRVLDFIKDYTKRVGYAPSHGDIVERFRFGSKNAVRGFLRILQRKGWIKQTPRIARGLVVIK